MPFSSLGFSGRVTTTVKKLYMTTNQSRIPAAQKSVARRAFPVVSMTSVPSTQVPATRVKKPGALA
jgi:hypothetical protein